MPHRYIIPLDIASVLRLSVSLKSNATTGGEEVAGDGKLQAETLQEAFALC